MAVAPATSSVSPVQGLSPQQLAATKKAAQDFEAVFISEMLSHMFKGLETDPMFGGGPGEDMFRGMMIQEYGKKMAAGHGIGISDQMQKMLIRMQQQG